MAQPDQGLGAAPIGHRCSRGLATSAHLKPVGAHRRQLGRGDTEHHSADGAPLTPEPQFVEAMVGPFRLQLDRSIRTIPHPAAEAHASGLLTARLAIADPVHLTTDDQMPTLLGGATPMVLALDPAFHGPAATAAATRRRGISGQPAQWRCSQLA